LSDPRGRPQGVFHERAVTPGMSRWIASPATRDLTAERWEDVTTTFLFVAVLAILAFLCFTGPDGVAGQSRRH
jgi:hypothetical protein